MTTKQQEISVWLSEKGYQRFGWAQLKRPVSFELYTDWLDKDYQGEMQYLKRHSAQKENPQLLLPQAAGAIVFAIDYYPLHPKATSHLKNQKIALYARGEDYHKWFFEELQNLALELSERYPDDVFHAATDSQPILERDLAARAGLGWVGKNTCLIDQKAGSLFLIGEILTSIQPETAEVIAPDRCGTCTKCIDICPTGAIVEPRQVDARLCISYLNIELKKAPPVELRKKMGDWFFGCDLCQTICPWNEKAFGKSKLESERHNISASRRESIEELKWILTSSSEEIEKRLQETPLLRRGAFGLKKNALLIIANKKLIELKSEVQAFYEQLLVNKNELSELANWTLNELETS